MDKLKKVLFLLGIIIIAALVYYVGPSDIFSKTKEARYDYLLLAGCLFFLSTAIRSLKWNIGLKVLEVDCGIGETFWVYLFSGMICYFTPLKTGDIVAPFMFKKHFNHSVGSGASVVFVDRIIEFIVMIFLIMVSAVALTYRLPDVSSVVSGIINGVIALLAITVVIMAIISIFQDTTRRVLTSCHDFFRSPGIKNIIEKAIQTINNFYASIHRLKDKYFILKILFITCLVWAIDIITFYFIINSMITVGLTDCFIALFIIIGVSLASFMPTGLGTAELTAVYLFSLLGYPTLPVTTSMVIMRAITMGITVLTGLLAMVVMRGWSRKYDQAVT